MSDLLFEDARLLLSAVDLARNKAGKLPPLPLMVMEAKSLFSAQDATEKKKGKLPLLNPPPPKKFADLLDEDAIRAVYNDRHSDSYVRALKLADSRERGATKAFHKLIRAAESAYLIGFGPEFMPVPKVHFLHRGLLDLAKLCGLDALTNEGLEEFFEDLCHCGKKHNAEALRKLRKRVANQKRR